LTAEVVLQLETMTGHAFTCNFVYETAQSAFIVNERLSVELNASTVLSSSHGLICPKPTNLYAHLQQYHALKEEVSAPVTACLMVLQKKPYLERVLGNMRLVGILPAGTQLSAFSLPNDADVLVYSDSLHAPAYATPLVWPIVTISGAQQEQLPVVVNQLPGPPVSVPQVSLGSDMQSHAMEPEGSGRKLQPTVFASLQAEEGAAHMPEQEQVHACKCDCHAAVCECDPTVGRCSNVGRADILRVPAVLTQRKHKATALLDTGASGNFIHKEYVSKHGMPVGPKGELSRVLMGNGSVGHILGTTSVKVAIGAFHMVVQFHVLDLCEGFDFILGLPWLKQHCDMEFSRNRLMLRKDGHSQKVSVQLC
jgi:hypothetical protein